MDTITNDLLNEAIWVKLLKKPKGINVPVEDIDFFNDDYIKTTKFEKIPFPDYINDEIIALTLPQQVKTHDFTLKLLKSDEWAALFENESGEVFSFTHKEMGKAIAFAALRIIGLDVRQFNKRL